MSAKENIEITQYEENPQHKKSYIGISETSFKKPYANHKKSFLTSKNTKTIQHCQKNFGN